MLNLSACVYVRLASRGYTAASHSMFRPIHTCAQSKRADVSRSKVFLLPKFRRTDPETSADKSNGNTRKLVGGEASILGPPHRTRSPNNKHRSGFSAWSCGKSVGEKSVIDPNTNPGCAVGVSYTQSSSKESAGDQDRMFPSWLLREMEFRQLTCADPTTLERRREEAATWIKQEVCDRAMPVL